jgi:hypothetical protein
MMDLETNMTDAYAYTSNELEKNLALAEVHAKQFGEDPYFCKDCLRKHFIVIEGLADEGINFTDDNSEKIKFQKISQIMSNFKSNLGYLTKENAFLMADGLRKIRKGLYAPALVMSNPKIVKDLNTQSDKVSITRTNGVNIMVELKKIGVLLGSQFMGYGVKEAGTYVDTLMGKAASPSFEKPSTWIDIGGGLAMALIPQFVGVGDTIKLILTVIGTQRIADKTIQLAKEYMVTPPARYGGGMAVPIRLGGSPARSVSMPISAPFNGGLIKVD